MEYRVSWTIDVEAQSLEDAARIALEIQRDPKSLATHFIVRDKEGNDRELWADPAMETETKTKGILTDI